MNSEYTILWIDDDSKRREKSNEWLGRDDRIEVLPFAPMDIASELIGGDQNTLDQKNPDLALVDWYLQTDGYGGDGPSIEGILHDQYSDMPVYGFSGQYGDRQFMRESKQGENRFEIITAPDKITAQDLIDDIKYYRAIESKKGGGLSGILDLLGADAEYKQKIQSILPQEFVEGIPEEENYDPGGILRFARWVRHRFIPQPGLLWDDIWLATKLGMTTGVLERYQEEFSQAEYNGIFSHRTSRWWRPEVTSHLAELADEQGESINRTWKDAPTILGISQYEIAECVVCDNKYPETVAAGKADEKPEFQVHFRCSNIEISRSSPFEDIRVLVRQ